MESQPRYWRRMNVDDFVPDGRVLSERDQADPVQKLPKTKLGKETEKKSKHDRHEIKPKDIS
jgi:hypothetical protein